MRYVWRVQRTAKKIWVATRYRVWCWWHPGRATRQRRRFQAREAQ